MQPLIIDLRGKNVVIVGGGRIAARKAHTLAAEEALITFIAPAFSEEVRNLAEKEGYALVERIATYADFEGALLVILATNDREANAYWAKCIPPDRLVCVVDEQDEGNVIFPATVRRGHLQIAVSSNGASPKLTRKLKQQLEEQFDESWNSYTSFLADVRKIVKESGMAWNDKQAILQEVLDDCYRLDQERRASKLAELSSGVLP
ncbi:precorrin-2 dehydrogenase/sirohydrochlorin ferrochelatase family protein [Bacillus testis]|uniref:precorrin-2 dehydrogenase/sirohydrochlorin ferrochelatase family protein n=1 Tax=Bacillus testis TaxID=1622072 RepID=UPI00067E8205|nr:NAD(P)-dependent oxidoreductase [Bacillus testis]